jgi:BirA family transcriptional regulator, biotin operon repressor / biotin---[acetyl-CoA-carboxylase] ligase
LKVAAGRVSFPGLAGYRHLAFGDVGSTNAVALDHARAGDPGNLWITARRQLQGRGRRGRPWISEEGNLYASLLAIDPAPLEKIGTLPLVAALGVYRTLRPYFAGNPHVLAIKWPNDILVDGRKINGILLESESRRDGQLAAVIGCGINCAHHPDNPLYPATDLRACGVEVSPEDLFPQLAGFMEETISLWNRGAGFAAIREEWLRAARGVGEPVTVNLNDRQLHGRFEEIDPDGYLCLRTKDGQMQKISAGDLFFSAGGGHQ